MPKLHGIAAMRKAKDLLGGQNSRFWMSATSRTVIVRGVEQSAAFCVFPGGCTVNGRTDGTYRGTRRYLSLTTVRQGEQGGGCGHVPGLRPPGHVNPQPPVRVRLRRVHPGPGVVPDPQVA